MSIPKTTKKILQEQTNSSTSTFLFTSGTKPNSHIQKEDFQSQNISKMDAQAAFGEAKRRVEKKFYPSLMRALFRTRNISAFKDHQPFMMGFYDRPVNKIGSLKKNTAKTTAESQTMSTAMNDNSLINIEYILSSEHAKEQLNNLREQIYEMGNQAKSKQLHDGHLRPHIHFVVIVPESTPCGIPLRERFEELYKSQKLTSLWEDTDGVEQVHLSGPIRLHEDDFERVIKYISKSAVADACDPSKNVDLNMLLLPAFESKSMYEEFQRANGFNRKKPGHPDHKKMNDVQPSFRYQSAVDLEIGKEAFLADDRLSIIDVSEHVSLPDCMGFHLKKEFVWKHLLVQFFPSDDAEGDARSRWSWEQICDANKLTLAIPCFDDGKRFKTMEFSLKDCRFNPDETQRLIDQCRVGSEQHGKISSAPVGLTGQGVNVSVSNPFGEALQLAA